MTIARIAEFVGWLGYAPGQVRRDYPVWTGGAARRLDLVAFAHEAGPHDSSTALMVGEAVRDHASRSAHADVIRQCEDSAGYLGAPVLVVGGNESAQVLRLTASGGSDLVDEGPYGRLARDWASRLSPAELFGAKLGARQTALFPVDLRLLESSRRRGEQKLGPRLAIANDVAVEAMLNRAARGPANLNGVRDLTDAVRAAALDRAALLVVGCLTAVVLRDKERPPGLVAVPAPEAVLDLAGQTHPDQFEWLASLERDERELAEALVEDLASIDFTSVAPSLLSDLYETRITREAERIRLGAYYTPPALARQVLAHLPVEELAPEDRTVLDPTCGSGTLLLAAHDRLRALQPEPDSARAHVQLTTLLSGRDLDPVAVRIAGLSLLLHAAPAGNGWHVEQADVLRPRPAREPKPTVVVANPPWRYGNTGARGDLSDRVLNRLIDLTAPGGLLGVLMPASFLTRETSRPARERLTEACDVLEAWRLPAGTFQSADNGAAVLLARRRQPGSDRPRPPALIRDVGRREAVEAFLSRGRAGVALLPAGAGANDLGLGRLTLWWRAQRYDGLNVGYYATAVSGSQRERPDVLAKRATLPDDEQVRVLIGLGRAGYLRRIPQTATLPAVFPRDMQNRSRRGAAGLGRAKVVVPAANRPGRPWRLRVAVDEIGYLCTNSHVMLIPRDPTLANDLSSDDVLYAVAGLMCSSFAARWVDEVALTRNLTTDMYESMPAPPPARIRVLAKLARAAVDAADFGDSEELARRLAAVEREVWAWADVPADVAAAVTARLDEADAPEGRRRRLPFTAPSHEPAPDARGLGSRTVRRPGAVLEVGPAGVLVDVPGVTVRGGEWMTVPPRMPAGMLPPGTAFTVRHATGQALADARFDFDELAYLDDDQVAALLDRDVVETGPAGPARS